MSVLGKRKAGKGLYLIFTLYYFIFTVFVPSLQAAPSALEGESKTILHTSAPAAAVVEKQRARQLPKARLLFYHNFLKSANAEKKHCFKGMRGAVAEVVGSVSLYRPNTKDKVTWKSDNHPAFFGNAVRFNSGGPSMLKLADAGISPDMTLSLYVRLESKKDQMFLFSPCGEGTNNFFLGWFNQTLQAGINSGPNETGALKLSGKEMVGLKLVTGKFHHLLVSIRALNNGDSLIRVYVDRKPVNRDGFILAAVIRPERHNEWILGGQGHYSFTGLMGPVFGFAGSHDPAETGALMSEAESSYAASHLLATPSLARGIVTGEPSFPEPDPLAGLREMEPMIPNQRGNAAIEYALKTPPGLHDLTPSLLVTYSSTTKRGNLGVGWNIPFSSLELDTRRGVPAYDGSDPLVLNGKELVQVARDQYRFRTDDVMWIILKRPNNYFVALRPDGTKLFYGKDEASRIFDLDNPSQTCKWLLSSMEDTFGNRLRFEYEASYRTIAGKTFCAFKRPKYIHYGCCSGGTDRYSHRVEIAWRDEGQYHRLTNMRPGFPTENNGLIAEIRMQFRSESGNEPFQTLWKYRFVYLDPGYRTLDKYLLASITELYGPENHIVNQYTFGYYEAAKLEDEESGQGSFPLLNAFSGPASFAVPDFSTFHAHYDDLTGGHMRHLPLNFFFDRDLNGDQADDLREQAAIIEFRDFNGDGLADLIGKNGDHPLDVLLNTGNGFVERAFGSYPGNSLSLQLYTSQGEVLNTHAAKSRLLHDINADGRPDAVEQTGMSLTVHANGQAGFLAVPWTIRHTGSWEYRGRPEPSQALQDTYYSFTNLAQHTVMDFIDMNGDNLPDRVLKPSGSNFEVHFNTGDRIEKEGDGLFPHPAFNGEFGNRSVWGEGLALTGREDRQDLRMARNYGAINSTAPIRRWHRYKGYNVDLQDINGDGLPDRIANEGTHLLEFVDGEPRFAWNYTVPVQLNTGRGFMEYHSWEAEINRITGEPWQNYPLIGWQIEAQRIAYAYPAGESAKGNHTVSLLSDVDGDGLLDRVACDYARKKTFVQFNTGDGFGERIYRLNIVGLGYSRTNNVYEEPDYEYHVIKTLRYQEADFKDVTGDGLPDQVEKRIQSDRLFCRRNMLTNTNLLKEITNTQTLTRAGLEYGLQALDPGTDNYRRQQVLKKISLANTKVTPAYRKEITLDYGRGIYDAAQREFRGFTTVTAKMEYPDGPADRNVNPRWYQKVAYEVSRDTGMVDVTGNLIYDRNLKGQRSSITRGIFIPSRRVTRYIPLEKTEFLYDKIQLLTPSGAYPDRAGVTLVYPINVWNKIYDDEGTLLGELGKVFSLETDEQGLLRTEEVHLKGAFSHRDVRVITTFTSRHAVVAPGDGDLVFLMAPEKLEMRQFAKTCAQTRFHYHRTYLKPDRVTQDIFLNGEDTGEDLVREFSYDSRGNFRQVTAQGLTSLINTTYRIRPGSPHEPFLERTISIPGRPATRSVYDVAGRLIESTDAYGDRTLVRYDEKGRLAGTDKELAGRTTQMSRFEYGLENFLYKTQATYAHPDNPIAGAGGELTVHCYRDLLGRTAQIKRETDVQGVRAWSVSGKIERDFKGRIVKIGLPASAPLVSSGFIPTLLVTPTEYHYDRIGRLQKIIYPNGLTITKEYEKLMEGNPLKKLLLVETTSDNDGHSISVYRDALGSIVKRIQKTGRGTSAETRFEYDLLGNTTIFEPEPDLQGEIQVDSIGRLNRQKTPDAGVKEYRYNNRGLLARVVDYGLNTALDEASARVTRLTYDRFNRLEAVDFPGRGNDVLYAYYPPDIDPSSANRYRRANIQSIRKGELTESGISHINFQVDYDYRASAYSGGYYTLQESKQIGGERYTHQYHYDLLGRISVLEYPSDSEMIGYFYDHGARLATIVGFRAGSPEINPYLRRIHYNERGQRTRVEYGNGNIIAYTYQPDTALLDEMKVYNEDAITYVGEDGRSSIEDEVLLDFRYGYNLSGGLTKLDDYGREAERITEQTYAYDRANRLSGSSGMHQDGRSYIRGFEFDDALRVKTIKYFGRTITGEGHQHNFSYKAGRHAVDDIQVGESPDGIKDMLFGFDGFGNMLGRETHYQTGEKSERFYTYNALNQLTQITDPDFDMTFEYDHLGQRTEKAHVRKTGGEPDPASASITRYVSGLYSIRAGVPNKHLSDGRYLFATRVGNHPDNTLYYAQDHLGSTVMVTDHSGKKMLKRLYVPFGETWIKQTGYALEGLSEPERMYTNQILDESGLYYYNARYYDPDLGMFLTPDPAAYGLNHYVYANGNPVVYNDPSGKKNIWAQVLAVVLGTLGGALYTRLTSDETTSGYDYAKNMAIGAIGSAGVCAGGAYFAGVYESAAITAAGAGFSGAAANAGAQLTFESAEYLTLPESNPYQRFDLNPQHVIWTGVSGTAVGVHPFMSTPWLSASERSLQETLIAITHVGTEVAGSSLEHFPHGGMVQQGSSHGGSAHQGSAQVQQSQQGSAHQAANHPDSRAPQGPSGRDPRDIDSVDPNPGPPRGSEDRESAGTISVQRSIQFRHRGEFELNSDIFTTEPICEPGGFARDIYFDDPVESLW